MLKMLQAIPNCNLMFVLLHILIILDTKWQTTGLKIGKKNFPATVFVFGRYNKFSLAIFCFAFGMPLFFWPAKCKKWPAIWPLAGCCFEPWTGNKN